MAKQTETLLKSESKPEVIEVMRILNELSADEKKEMLFFMQGVRFAKGLERGRVPEAVPTI